MTNSRYAICRWGQKRFDVAVVCVRPTLFSRYTMIWSPPPDANGHHPPVRLNHLNAMPLSPTQKTTQSSHTEQPYRTADVNWIMHCPIVGRHWHQQVCAQSPAFGEPNLGPHWLICSCKLHRFEFEASLGLNFSLSSRFWTCWM